MLWAETVLYEIDGGMAFFPTYVATQCDRILTSENSPIRRICNEIQLRVMERFPDEKYSLIGG